MKVLRTLFGDLGLIGLAVMFGWALWYVVRGELNETQPREILVSVEADTGLAATPAVQKVLITVQGPRSAIEGFRSVSAPRLVRRLSLADLPAGADETRRDFSKEDLDFAAFLGNSALSVVEMEPQVISVQVFRMEVQEKTVAPPEFPGAADLSLRHVLLGYTNRAKVRGAVSVLSTFREIRSFVGREQLQGFAESLRDNPKSTVRMVLEIDPSQRDLFTLVEPKELSARVELSRVAEQELVLPLQILVDSARASKAARRLQFAELNKPAFLAGSPPRVRLMVTGVPSALASLNPARVRAFVLESDLAEDQRNGDVPVHVADLPPGVALTQEYRLDVEEAR